MLVEELPQKAFAELSREVQALVRGLPASEHHAWEMAIFAGRAALFAAGVALYARTGWASQLAGIVVMAYAYYGIGITGVHEASHNSFVASKAGNRFWSYVFSDFWSAQSSDWWHRRHVQLHHVYTNRPDLDEPLFTYPWLN